jgi:hypothetical protein
VQLAAVLEPRMQVVPRRNLHHVWELWQLHTNDGVGHRMEEGAAPAVVMAYCTSAAAVAAAAAAAVEEEGAGLPWHDMAPR